MYVSNYNLEPPQYDFGNYKLALDSISQLPMSLLALNRSQADTKTTHSQAHNPLPSVECVVRARIPTTTGAELWLHVYKNNIDNKDHLAFVFGDSIKSRSLHSARGDETEMDRMIRGAYTGHLRPGRTSSHDAQESAKGRKSSTGAGPPLVRVHSECYTGETTWSARCDCGEQLDEAAQMMIASGDGVIVYLRQEGRGIGLADKLKAYNLQDMGLDTVDANLSLGRPADARTYGLATAILVDLGLGNDLGCPGIRLLTNNPDKIQSIEGLHGEVTVKERVPIIPLAWGATEDREIRSLEFQRYLQVKIDKMGHLL
ncbi:GTP cyclohydrolase II [Penicillium sp. IBT 35674x]|nr:GTP cyclohydrolase II [Penicillium sp. IBT 35674x]